MKNCSPFSLLSASVCLWVAALLIGCSASTSPAPSNGTPQNPPVTATLTVTSIAPTSIPAGAAAITLTVSGTGFQSTSTIQVSGTSIPTTYISATQLTGILSASSLINGAMLQVVVLNGTTSSATGSTAISLEVDNPVPSITSFFPSQILAMGQSIANIVFGFPPPAITITGTGFVPSTVVQINGNARPTTYIDATHVSAAPTFNDLANVGTAALKAVNPTPGGGTSAAGSLQLLPWNPNVPYIQSFTPSRLVTNSLTILVLTGSFRTDCVVSLNQTPLASSLPPAIQHLPSTVTPTLDVYIPESLVASPGTALISVTCPSSPTPSNYAPITISQPSAPTITSITPGAIPLDKTTMIFISGTNFTDSSIVNFDGVSVPILHRTSVELTAQIPAAMVSVLGPHSVSVITPAPPNGGTSDPFPVTAMVGIPNNAMAMNPANGLLYISVPSSAGPPYGNSVVSVDPSTGAVGTPIPVGSEPDKLAISSDGTTLWVGLDGAYSVRKVDLVTGTAGMQFPIASVTTSLAPTAHAIVALPGASNSIAVSYPTNMGSPAFDNLAIYDNGVPRPNQISLPSEFTIPAIFAGPTKPEIYTVTTPSYGMQSSGYAALSYDTNGLTRIGGNSALGSATALQVDNGRAYLNNGQVLDAETGALLGTFYTSANMPANGPMVSDSALGKNFVLTGSTYNMPPYSQTMPVLRAFQESDFSAIPSTAIPIPGPLNSTSYPRDTMVRWGSNGIAFRASNGIFSVRSNLVRDLSTVNADLSVSISAPATAATGSTITLSTTVVNHGPSTATDVVLNEIIPANATLVSATSSQGSCSVTSPVQCNLGSVANGATITANIAIDILSAGTTITSSTIFADQNDSVPSNNTANVSIASSGATFATVPVLTSIAPAIAQAGATDLTLTVNGSGFGGNSVVYMGATPLATTLVNDAQLQANVPSTLMTALGWYPVTVSNPAPGGGVSKAQPFSVFSVVNLTAKHMLYDPYTRLLYASVSSAATEVTGNSIVTINPTTSTLGTPVSVGSQPDTMALTQDGQELYVNLPSSSSVGRFNMLSQSLEFTYPISLPGGYPSPTLKDIATSPGTDTVIAVNANSALGIWDIDPVAKTGTARPGLLGSPYAFSSLQFYDSSMLLSGTGFNRNPVSIAGLSTPTAYSLFGALPFKLKGTFAYGDNGEAANVSATSPVYSGTFPVTSYSLSAIPITEPDPSLGISFFALPTGQNAPAVWLLQAFSQSTFNMLFSFQLSPSDSMAYASVAAIDLARWGQDGLALLTDTSKVILFRGGLIVPQLLTQNTAATLTSSSNTTLTHGTGNVLLTVTGSNLLPGVTALWNGSYRTTTILDATHLTVAIPASDLTQTGNAALTLVNPGAPSSAPLTITIN